MPLHARDLSLAFTSYLARKTGKISDLLPLGIEPPTWRLARRRANPVVPQGGVRVPFTTSTISSINHLGFRDALTEKQQRSWDNVHESPRTAPSKGVKMCMYHRWFSPPDRRCSSPY